MRILYLIDSLDGGGAETSLVDTLPALIATGIDTTVVTLLADDGVLRQRVRATGSTTTHVDVRHPRPAWRQLRALVARHEPDLIHTTLLRADLIGRALGRRSGVPVVTTLPNDSYGPQHSRNARFGAWSVAAVGLLDRASSPLTTRFHAISHTVAATMSRRLRIAPGRIDVVYRGRDQQRLGRWSTERRARARTGLGLAPAAPVVAVVARLDRQKGVDTAIEAFALLRRRIPDAVLLIAGRAGNAAGDVHRLAGETPNVRLLGQRDDVPELMCAADVLAFPSRWEGLGGTLLEAMALALPIVGTTIAPVAETLAGVPWPLVPPDRADLLAAELHTLLAGPAAHAAIGELGRQRFLQHFTTDAAAQGMAACYRRALNGSPVPLPTVKDIHR